MENILFLLVIFQQKLYNKDTMIRERSVSGLAEDFVIEMLNITKEFPGIKANDDITLQLRKGEVHALLGETAPANQR